MFKRCLFWVLIFSCVFFFGVFISHWLWPSEQKIRNQSIEDKAHKPLYWVAPMDPNYRQDKPGKSPMGMDLVPVYADAKSTKEATVFVSPAMAQNLGVRTAPVTRQNLSRQINTVGYVAVDENQIEHLHTYTSGWIKKLSVRTAGEHVKKGQLLFEIYSPTLINAQEEYLLALKDRNRSFIKASHAKMRALGISEVQIQKIKKNKKTMELVSIYAGRNGIISSLNVREGMYVKPNLNVITIENLKHIWIIGEVFENQALWVKKGQRAQALLPFLENKMWEGHVDFVYPRLDAINRTLKVRLRFDNPDETLKPNMYVDFTVFASPKENVLAIPKEAVIYSEEGARAVISLGDGYYFVKHIVLGTESGGLVEVMSGLKEGEKVVISSQFLIDSESNLRTSLNRIDSTHSHH